MTKNRKPRNVRTKRAQAQPDEGVPLPTFINDEGNKMVLLRDTQGQWRTVEVAGLVATSFLGPRPDGHVLRFKDGDRLNCVADNLEWVPSELIVSDQPERSRSVVIHPYVWQ